MDGCLVALFVLMIAVGISGMGSCRVTIDSRDSRPAAVAPVTS